MRVFTWNTSISRVANCCLMMDKVFSREFSDVAHVHEAVNPFISRYSFSQRSKYNSKEHVNAMHMQHDWSFSPKIKVGQSPYLALRGPSSVVSSNLSWPLHSCLVLSRFDMAKTHLLHLSSIFFSLWTAAFLSYTLAIVFVIIHCVGHARLFFSLF